MKKLNSIPRFTLILLFVMSAFINADAQTPDERLAVKNWIIANNDKVTLVSADEYQSMSPAVRAMIDGNKKTIIYDKIVTVDNIMKFLELNISEVYIPFHSEKKPLAEKVENIISPNEEVLTKEKLFEKDPVAFKKYYKPNKPISKIDKWAEDNHVRIYSQNQYNSLSKEIMEKLKASDYDLLIYEGNTLTMEDINNFKLTRSKN
jgi:hypothetical protein